LRSVRRHLPDLHPRDQLVWSSRASQSNSAKWIRSHTPASCQSHRRRQRHRRSASEFLWKHLPGKCRPTVWRPAVQYLTLSLHLPLASTDGSSTRNVNKTGVRLWTLASRPPAGPAQVDTNARQTTAGSMRDQQHRRHEGDGANVGGATTGHWLTVRLVGDPARKCPRDAIGSVVFVTAGHAAACRGLERTWADLIGPAATLRSRTAHDAVEGRGIQPLRRSQGGRGARR